MLPNPFLAGRLSIGSLEYQFSTTAMWHQGIASWPSRLRQQDEIVFTRHGTGVAGNTRVLPAFRVQLPSGPSLFALLATAADLLMGGLSSVFGATSYQFIIRPIGGKRARSRGKEKTQYEALWVMTEVLPRHPDLLFEVLEVPGFIVERASRGTFELERMAFKEERIVVNEDGEVHKLLYRFESRELPKMEPETKQVSKMETEKKNEPKVKSEKCMVRKVELETEKVL